MMKSYTPALIGWIALLPVAGIAVFDKNIRLPDYVAVPLGLVMFAGQFMSLFWGLWSFIVNSNKKDDLIALVLSGGWLILMIAGFATDS